MSLSNVQSGIYADSPTGGFPGTLASVSGYTANTVESYSVIPIPGGTTENGIPAGFAVQFQTENVNDTTPGGNIGVTTVISDQTLAWVGIAVRGYLPTNNVNYGADTTRQVAGYPDNSIISVIPFKSNAVIYVEIPVTEIIQYGNPVWVADDLVNDSGIARGAISTGIAGTVGLTQLPGAFFIDSLTATTDNRVARIRLGPVTP